ncbi:MAG: phosphonate C-P lyase system protein PhnL [Hyphomicrobiaceae bacterium]|nr:phosphonate C-P lyase system protein PhnL [Hyphomicrobiaceae bacterium]
MTTILRLEDVSKTFVLHLMGGVRLPVVAHVSFEVKAGRCAVLAGPSGAGKSSILKMVYGNYRCDSGRILVRDGEGFVDIALAAPRRILKLRDATIGYVSQFLRVIPRVSTLDIVASAAAGSTPDPEAAARHLLRHLSIPERLWRLPPATFSGGEQQRVNIARGFIASRPLLLLDEPTASLDARNRGAVMELVEEKKRSGVGILAIFHDADVRDRLGDDMIDVTTFAGHDTNVS